MFLITLVNLFATMNAMFVRTFVGVLGLPAMKYCENEMSPWFSPWWNKSIRTWMNIEKLTLDKRSSSSKKVEFELSKNDIADDIIQFTSSPFTKNDKCDKKHKYKSKDANRVLKRWSKNDDVSDITITYLKESKLKALYINVKNIKRLDKDNEDHDPTDSKYRIVGRYEDSDDALFDTINDARIVFNSTKRYNKRKNQKQNWDCCSDSDDDSCSD